MAGAPQLGWVRISSVDPPITILARLSDARPNVTAGYGGWTEVVRPRRRPISVWAASPGLRMDLAILLDRWRIQSSVELQIAQLERLATPNASDGSTSRIRLNAPGGGVPHQGRVWVIDTLTWGDALANAKGNRVRQQVTLGLLEYIADVRVDQGSSSQQARAKAAMATTKPGAAVKRVIATRGRPQLQGRTVRSVAGEPGEDLLSIAARELGDADRWTEIAALNGIRDPRTIKLGQVIRLP